jgi:hypothetical protein
MAELANEVEVYLEAGTKRVFACALNWPGWSRSGRDEAAALAVLGAYARRYAAAVGDVASELNSSDGEPDFTVLDRLEGNATTDFGAPDAVPALDRTPMTTEDLLRHEAILRACWDAFEGAAAAAEGRDLQKGPRGGGRDLERMLHHVGGAEAGYLSRIAARFRWDEKSDPRPQLAPLRAVAADALRQAQKGLPAHGPRGGAYWTARTYVRRAAWHLLDHAWELEDRVV